MLTLDIRPAIRVCLKTVPYEIAGDKTNFVRIDRATRWGNPFVKGRDGSLSEVIDKYEQWLMTKPHLLKDIRKLRNKILGCWCHPMSPCHGDVLIRLSGLRTVYDRSIEIQTNDPYPSRLIDYLRDRMRHLGKLHLSPEETKKAISHYSKLVENTPCWDEELDVDEFAVSWFSDRNFQVKLQPKLNP